MCRVSLRDRGDADVLEIPAYRLGVPMAVRLDERERERGVDVGTRLVGDSTAEHLEMSGHTVAKSDLKALGARVRSEEHTSELQSLTNLVCRLLLEKKKTKISLRFN